MRHHAAAVRRRRSDRLLQLQLFKQHLIVDRDEYVQRLLLRQKRRRLAIHRRRIAATADAAAAGVDEIADRIG